jgi:predicted enzyme related to lactoylglutathione lyase
MILGMRTVIYPVTDLAKGRAWYEAVLERPPYFSEPYYVGFAVGGFELGLIPDGKPGPMGAIAYWGVADAAAEMTRLVTLGATVVEPLQEVGQGIKTATVSDPFGNTFGVIENPHFKKDAVE